MAYGLKYTCDFGRLDATGDTYTLEILQDGYAGAVIPVTGAAVPVTHTWETDEPKAPIKGSSLAITLINENNIPLSDLYSTNDQEFKATFSYNIFGGGTVLLYEGFIIQDDSSEIMVDFSHEITLSSNDNLGLLKDVSFKAALDAAAISEYDLITLLKVIELCLKETGLELTTRIFANINETSQSPTDCFLEQTLVDPHTFNSGSSWDDCYNVLEKILGRFNACLFQAKGYWNIVRWDEARYYDYAVPGFIYDPAFTLQPAQALDESNALFAGYPKFLIGIGEESVAETGLLQTITRPNKYERETFNYRQPEELLRNANLQQLGSLITTYTTGSGATLKTIREYDVPWWTIIAGSYTGTPEYFIRVVEDSLGNEIDRALIIKNGAIESYPIQAAHGDRFVYSFSVVTLNSRPGNYNTIFEIKDYDGITTNYLQDLLPAWAPTVGYAINIPSGDNGNVTHTFDISGTIPFDGLLTVSLEDMPGATETQYRDIRMEYIPMINQSTKIIGHTHTSEQILTIKNTNEKEVYIDSSPRSSISGALFLNSLTGLLQTRAGQWKRSYVAGTKNLGEITTFENLYLRRIPRTLLEGTFHGLLSAGNHLSLLALINYTFFPDHNFIFGRLEIDYRNNSASGTLYELYKVTEVDADLVYLYAFQYLYATK